jgi:hypothetical protein
VPCGSSLGTEHPSGAWGKWVRIKEDSAHRVFAVGALQPLKAASFKDRLDVPLDMAALGILVQPRDSFRIVGKQVRIR